jgi:poly(A) polymerase
MVGEEQNAYAGRWVARLRGRVVAHGGTPDQARRLAQSRYKETPEIVFMPTLSPLSFPPILDSVRRILPQDVQAFLVGGAVRDALLGGQPHDLDFALSRDGIPIARLVANALQADFYPLDPERDTGRVLLTTPEGSRWVMDFAVFRGAERPSSPGQNLEADLRGRDFTINAIAYDLRDGSLHDPLGGAKDLQERILRACSPSTFSDDPVRILRAVRLAAEIDLHILPEARRAMKAAASRLRTTSPERLRDEIFRLLAGPRPAACLRALDLLGALEPILPELMPLKGLEQPAPHVHSGWDHTLATLDHLSGILTALAPDYDPEAASDLADGLLVLRLGRYRRQIGEHLDTPLTPNRGLRGLLFLAALYHDVAKPLTRQTDENGQLHYWDHDQQGAGMAAERARQLALSNDEILRLETIIRNHMRIMFHANRLEKEGKPPSHRAVYRFFRDTGEAGVDVVLLALADFRATYQHTLVQEHWAACLEVCRTLLEAWWEKREQRIDPPALLDGDDLMREFGLPPGPQIGKLLEVLREAQATGEVTSRAQALALARSKRE